MTRYGVKIEFNLGRVSSGIDISRRQDISTSRLDLLLSVPLEWRAYECKHKCGVSLLLGVLSVGLKSCWGKGRIVFVLSDKNCGERLKEKGRRRDSGRCKQNRQLLALTPTKILRWNFLGIHCSPLSHNCVLRRVNFRSTLANNGVVIDAIYIRLSFFTVHLAALIKTSCFEHIKT